MNVKELIDLTNQLSLDEATTTTKGRQRYLKYLNLANMELFAIAAGGLKTIIKVLDVFVDEASQSFKLPDDLYKIRLIYINRTRLLPADIDNFFNIEANKYLVINDSIYTNLTNSSSNYLSKIDPIDNVTRRYITLIYVPNPQQLVENVTNPVTETDTPVYPIPYHHFLAHGALYYFYFSNKVFMEKMAYIKDIWDSDKKELANFKNYGL